MSVGVKGQYFYKFSLGNINDFIDERDFLSFTMIEKSGNVLPTFQLVFTTDNDTVLPLLNEGNQLKVSFGKDLGGLVDAALAVTGLESYPSGASRIFISVTGIYSAVKYFADNVIAITPAQSGIETVISRAKQYFKVQGNVTKSNDTQKWIQANVSDRNLVNQAWMHSDLSPSFPAVGISSDGQFIIKDIKKDLAQPYAWRFGRVQSDPLRDIVITGDPHTKSQTGFINTWLGYGREKLVYDIEAATATPTLVPQTPLMAMTDEMARSKDVTKRFASIGVVNENVHPLYWEAYQRNLTFLASFLNICVTVSFQNVFQSVRVLDQVMYKSDDLSTTRGSSTYLSGIHYVTEVARTVQASQLTTTVKLNRESFNEIQTGL